METQFQGPSHARLRESITRFVQGFDAADARKASAFALREEWAGEDTLEGYHLEPGYGALMDYLYKECLAHGVVFHLSTEVNTINWKIGEAEVHSKGGSFKAEKVLITIPPSVL